MIFPADFEDKIGFTQIRAKLRSYCLNEWGIREVDIMRFSSEQNQIQVYLQQNLECLKIIQTGNEFPTTYFQDPIDLFSTIAIEDNFIEQADFWNIVCSLKTALACKYFFEKNKETYVEMHRLSLSIRLSDQLVNTLAAIFDDVGAIKNNASPELFKIRKRLAEDQFKIRKLSEQLFRQAVTQGWVPEGVSITIRDGRIVFPILAEHKKRISGVILDESATGQTIYIEPIEILEADNEIRDLLHAERREIIHILKQYTNILRVHLADIKESYTVLGKIDFIRAKAKLSHELRATLPQLSNTCALNWMQARHPLLDLTMQRNHKKMIPLDIRLAEEQSVLLISGPNAGGKSVCLKTLGLVQYMFQSGLLVPMDEYSTIGFFEHIFLDIGDQQSVENDLSTYSSHLKNMNYFLNHANEKTLVLMDELGSGTDPNFGGAIAEAVLSTLVEKKIWGVATTHYYNLKLFAENNRGIGNASMQFDAEKLVPLFRLDMQKPGSSFALEVARKIGLPESIITKAEKIVGKELIGIERLIKSVSEEKLQLERKQRELVAKEKNLTQTLSHYQNISTELELKKKQILLQAKIEASSLLKQTNKQIEKTIRHIQENRAEKKETKKIRSVLNELAKKVHPEEPLAPLNQQPTKLKVGDKVKMIGQDVTGVVLSIKNEFIVVQFGMIQSHVKTNQLIRSDLKQVDPIKKNYFSGIDITKKQLEFSPVLDVRGMRVNEVDSILEQFLDNAILLGQHELKILHGKGEGVLRKVIREKLKGTKQVISFKDDHIDFGGDGITVVNIK